MKGKLIMPTLLPPPEKHKLEVEISELLRPGDIDKTARYVQRDASLVSRLLSPNGDHNNHIIYFFILFLWAFDSIRRGLGDAIITIVLREREKWLAEDIVIEEHPATLTRKVGDELLEAIECEMKDEHIDDQIREWGDVRNRVQVKINTLNAKRAVDMYRRNGSAV